MPGQAKQPGPSSIPALERLKAEDGNESSASGSRPPSNTHSTPTKLMRLASYGSEDWDEDDGGGDADTTVGGDKDNEQVDMEIDTEDDDLKDQKARRGEFHLTNGAPASPLASWRLSMQHITSTQTLGPLQSQVHRDGTHTSQIIKPWASAPGTKLVRQRTPPKDRRQHQAPAPPPTSPDFDRFGSAIHRSTDSFLLQKNLAPVQADNSPGRASTHPSKSIDRSRSAVPPASPRNKSSDLSIKTFNSMRIFIPD